MKFGFDVPGKAFRYRRSLPFRRSWPAIGMLLGLDAVFLFPLFLTFGMAVSGWSEVESLFDLAIAAFLTAWLIGWSLGPVLITCVLLLVLFGREAIRVRDAAVELFIGVFGVGVTAVYRSGNIQNLRLEVPEKKSGNGWRGPHMVFDYGGHDVHFGSDVGESLRTELASAIEAAGGDRPIPVGTLPGERPEAAQRAIVAKPPNRVEAGAEPAPLSWTSPSALALIVANLVPVAGTVFLGWRLSDVMVLYWAESAVIGFFNVLKMIVIGRWGALLYGPFFIGHFGGFMAIHFLFIYTLFIEGVGGGADPSGDLAQVAGLFVSLWPALLALLLSHGISFFTNFLGRQEHRGRTLSKQMSEPYQRIVFMHLVIIIGGGLTMMLQDPAPVLILVIVVKIAVDLRSHLRERRQGNETRRAKQRKTGA